MLRIRSLTLAAIAGLAATPILAAAPAPAPRDYDVTMTMRDGDDPATHPRLIVREGEPATFTIGNPSYMLRMTATPRAGGEVEIASEVAVWTPHGLAPDGSTRTIRADGAPTSLTFTRTDPATGASRDVRIDLSVRPVLP